MNLIQFRSFQTPGQLGEQPSQFDGLQLARVTAQDQRRAGLKASGDDVRQLPGADHGSFIEHEHGMVIEGQGVAAERRERSMHGGAGNAGGVRESLGGFAG